jgi:ribose transport system ATP-binding protein
MLDEQVNGVRQPSGPMLAAMGISKRFGGTQALDNVSLELNQGSVVALLGENGAGKSTLIKILANVYKPDAGEIAFEGRSVSAEQLPIAFIHQDLGLIEWMTVAENICLSLGYPRRWGMISAGGMRVRALEALRQLGVEIDPDERVERLTRTEKALVAISRVLASNARIVVMDEPTASLPTSEVELLFRGIRRLRDSGAAVLYVSHRLDEVFEISDRIVVLRDGRLAGEFTTKTATSQDIVMAIIGREPSKLFSRTRGKVAETRLSLNQVALEGVGPISCEFRRGEIVGLVGLRGAGHDAIGHALFGLLPVLSGSIEVDGRKMQPGSPREAMAAGIQLIWGDRNNGSIVPGLSIKENLFLNQTAAGRSFLSYVSPGHESDAAFALGKDLGLRPNAPDFPIDALSGGNQQKVVIGRWLTLRGKIYVFEDPTAGVDIGARADIYRLFEMALNDGAAIVIVSTDFEEVANVCDRALVFDRGQVVAELSEKQLTTRGLISAASAGGDH